MIIWGNTRKLLKLSVLIMLLESGLIEKRRQIYLSLIIKIDLPKNKTLSSNQYEMFNKGPWVSNVMALLHLIDFLQICLLILYRALAHHI